VTSGHVDLEKKRVLVGLLRAQARDVFGRLPVHDLAVLEGSLDQLGIGRDRLVGDERCHTRAPLRAREVRPPGQLSQQFAALGGLREKEEPAFVLALPLAPLLREACQEGGAERPSS
jgi:hypothetical protein